MNIRIENMGSCQKKISVEIPEARVTEVHQRVLKEYVKGGRIKGFRPGKAPAQVVERQYGKQIYYDVREQLIGEGYREASKDSSLEVLQILDLQDVSLELGKPMTFSIQVEVAPEFDLPNYKGIALQREKVDVSDERVEQTLEWLQNQSATFEEANDQAVKKGDMVQVDYDAVYEGAPLEELGSEVKGLGTQRDFWVRTDENALFLEFVEGLEGTKVGDRKQIEVHFPDNFMVEALADKKVMYDVEIKAIRQKKLPEWTPEFLKNFGVENLDALKDQIREDIRRHGEEQEQRRLRNEAIKRLVEQVDVEMPNSSIERETQQVIEEIIRENRYRGVEPATLEEKRSEILEAADGNARERVKTQFVLDRIARAEKIEPTPSELHAYIERLAAGQGMAPSAFESELKKRNVMDHVMNELRRVMAVDKVMEEAAIEG